MLTNENVAGEDGAEAGVKAAAGVAATGLIAAGALHALWTVDPWPLKSAAEFAETVVGVTEDQLPSAPLTLGVAALLGAAGYLVLSNGRIARKVGPEKLNRVGLWTLAGVLAARGAGGLVASGLALRDAPEAHRHWDLVLYSPLCLTLAGLTGFVARRTATRRQGR
ncbi:MULTISPECIES: DUF3995 domain-containing protein [unclassified Streptomyces]|uniref:DUF3995 domain-containing protein n=1 Tax=unclassified Streptomyces TaxID=2593676 RepID=UPI001BECEDC0|nr:MULTISPECIES: DUF3995 domain-containing protein [unclassified Streptomyces]MBT2404257.1 DUF3995 domain-containing protein [Streptomyces sp. ISL-21]MBT2456294.1 DUF3995 domain-containing protein [Streptomyces sp. ISL-86]MBT2612934.1 DUF3995 domain-containing protein [Streptomyces sp. ISL-87]